MGLPVLTPEQQIKQKMDRVLWDISNNKELLLQTNIKDYKDYKKI